NYSLQDAGLAIAGLERASMQDLLDLPERRGEISRLFGEARAAIEREFHGAQAKDRAEKYENARKALLAGLAKVKSLADDAGERAETAALRNRQGRLEEKDRERTLKKLDAANKAIMESSVKEITGFLFPETGDWEAEIAAQTADPLARYMEFSARFYRALAQTAEYNLRILNEIKNKKG
ncbi:MAG: hypothetical protein FWC65_05410, partial [Treponema sp.]|nr:hypothetical protein [Treponema sp.]